MKKLPVGGGGNAPAAAHAAAAAAAPPAKTTAKAPVAQPNSGAAYFQTRQQPQGAASKPVANPRPAPERQSSLERRGSLKRRSAGAPERGPEAPRQASAAGGGGATVQDRLLQQLQLESRAQGRGNIPQEDVQVSSEGVPTHHPPTLVWVLGAGGW